MKKKETWLGKLLKDTPRQITFDSYYIEHIDIIRSEIDELLDFKISDVQFNRTLEPWFFRDTIVGRCEHYDFAALRNEIDLFVEKIEDISSDQTHIIRVLNFLSPLIYGGQIKNVITIDYEQLAKLEQTREELFCKNGSKGNKDYWTKRAFFELFFIGELLGLKLPTQNYQKNDLITFAKILTNHTNITRDNISDHYQDYRKVKEKAPVINALIAEGLRVRSNEERWSSFLEMYQTYIHPYITVPS